MKPFVAWIAVCMLLALQSPVRAQDSVRASGTASAASVAAVSIVPASVVVVSAYVGSVIVIESIRVVGDVVEVVFKGAVDGSRAVVTVTAAAARSASIVVGQAVNVVAEGTGYLLIAAGKVLCYVPGPADRSLMHSKRSY